MVPEGAEAEAQMPNPHMQPSLLAGIGASGRIVMKTKKGEKRKGRDTQSPWRTMTNRRPRIEKSPHRPWHQIARIQSPWCHSVPSLKRNSIYLVGIL